MKSQLRMDLQKLSDRGQAGRWTGVVLMMGILLLAFSLGAQGLGKDVIWNDELDSVLHMGVFDPPYSPLHVIESLATYSWDQVPLYFLLGSFWLQLAGWSPFALRFISLIAGILMVSWLFRFATDTFDIGTGLLSALLMSTNAFVLVYFHELKQYSLLLLHSDISFLDVFSAPRQTRCKRQVLICLCSVRGLPALYP